jgi:hypothetical protein
MERWRIGGRRAAMVADVVAYISGAACAELMYTLRHADGTWTLGKQYKGVLDASNVRIQKIQTDVLPTSQAKWHELGTRPGSSARSSRIG